jgi:hypothetical protein
MKSIYKFLVKNKILSIVALAILAVYFVFQFGLRIGEFFYVLTH